jgi:tetratricopeptide (TPR) repeat protein
MKTLKILTLAFLLLAVLPVEPVLAHASLSELIEYTTDLLSSAPDNPATLLDRAKFRLKQGENALALSDIKAAEHSSDAVNVAYVRALYFLAEDRPQQAIDAFGKYLGRYPGFTPAIHARARIYASLGQTELSIRDYQHLLSVSKVPSPDYYLELARLQSTLEPGGIRLALKSLDRGIENLGLLVSLQAAAIEYEMQRKAYRMALARHETLRPWLGNTEQWKLRQQQLAAKLLTQVNPPDIID